MFWLILAAGAVGCFFGLWLLRAHIIAVVSAVLVLACVGVGALAQWGLWASIGFMAALVIALQAGYLAGLLAAWAWWARAPQTILRSSDSDQCRR
jgi:hypothetical protein